MGDGLRTALPVALEVVEVRPENPGAVTVFLSLEGVADQQGLDLGAFQPGQFFMVWIPRMDEKPYAISYPPQGGRVGITVQRRGPFSTRLSEMRPGDRVGLRGPYGHGFWALDGLGRGEGVALIGGGCGTAVLAPLAERLPAATLVQGARTADSLFFTGRFPRQVIFTDDGSEGRRGFPTDWLAEALEPGRARMVYACGPEEMLVVVTSMCRSARVACQVSLERYMKCGIGVCGQCDCDGLRVCVEGPTLSVEELARMPSFGRVRRDKTGRAVRLGAADVCPSGPQQGPA